LYSLFEIFLIQLLLNQFNFSTEKMGGLEFKPSTLKAFSASFSVKNSCVDLGFHPKNIK